MSERIGVITDLHGHVELLESLLRDQGDKLDGLIVAGDTLGGAGTSATLDRCIEAGVRTIIANWEWGWLGSMMHADDEERGMMQQMVAGGAQYRQYQDLFEDYGVLGYKGAQEVVERLAEKMWAAGHIAYLLESALYEERDGFIVVHCGLTDEPWPAQQADLDAARARMQAGDFLDEPVQIDSGPLSRQAEAFGATDMTVITGHAHAIGKEGQPRLTANGKRVRLASNLDNGEPLYMWQGWNGQLTAYH